MYTDRQLKIIAVLKSADGWMSGSLLRENIGVSSRTLQMDIKAINEKQSGEPLIQSNNRLGYLLKNKIALEQEQKSYGQENYVHSKQIITLLLFEKEYTSIGTISERLFFSRSSVTSDLPQVKRIISRTPGADLLVSGQYGLKIQASENVKRIMCMKTMQSRQDYHMLFSEEEMEQFAENQKKLQAVLAEVFTRNQFIVSGEAYHDFARYLAVCMMRSQMGFPVTEEEDGTTEMPGRLSTELVDEIEKVCTYRFKEKEKQNVEARLKELNMVCKETDIQLDMLQKLEVFIQRVQEETGLNIRSPQLCGIKDWCEDQCRFVVLLYKATCFDGELRSSPEGRVWWEDIADLPKLKLSLDMRDMLRVFTEEALSEFFYYQEGRAWKYDLK